MKSLRIRLRGDRPRSRSAFRPGLLALIGSALLALPGCHADAAEGSAISDPAADLLSERFTTGRLAGQSSWSACTPRDTAVVVPVWQCGAPLDPEGRRAARIAAGAKRAGPLLRGNASPRELHAAALYDLALREFDTAKLTDAVELLRQAHDRSPDDAGIANDLAVAYLQLGEREQRLDPMLHALEMIERAAARDSSPAVLYNRALIAERLYLVRSAERHWSRYLDAEPSRRWRKEARAHLRRLAQVADTVSWSDFRDPPAPISARTRARIESRVKSSPQTAREFSFRLLGSWGHAVERGQHVRANRFLALAREIGAASVRLKTDRSVWLMVRAIDAAARRPDRVRALAAAHVNLGEGLELYGRGSNEVAARELKKAERALRSLGSPAAGWAAYYLAVSEVELTKFASADHRFRRLLKKDTTGMPALAGKATSSLGVSQVRRGNYEEAAQFYRDAASHLERAREPETRGHVRYTLTEALLLAGQSYDGELEGYRGLHALAPYRKSNSLNNHLATIATHAHDLGLSRAALAVGEEVMEVARPLRRHAVLAWALRARARYRTALGQASAAQTDLEVATKYAESLPDRGFRKRVLADVQRVEARLIHGRDPRAARAMLARTVNTYDKARLGVYLPGALYEAALADQAVGDRDGARTRLRLAVKEIEQRQATFRSPEIRASYNETVENVFDALIGLELEQGQPDSAFEYLERSRIAAWPRGERAAALFGDDARHTRITEIVRRLPDGLLLVDYALLDDRLVIWTATNRGRRMHPVNVTRDSVAALVDRLAVDMKDTHVGAGDERAVLYDLLLRPLAAELDSVDRIAVVPDRELIRVAFAALWDRRSGKYVVERHTVHTVPTVAFLLKARSSPRAYLPDGTALVVGNPALADSAAETRRDLPNAEAEAAQVAELYPRSRLLSGTQARKDEIVRRMTESSIFHFAGHAVSNADQPELSYLALAPGRDGGDGRLSAWEIGGLGLSKVSVAILSACSTMNPRPSRAGATAGLAYSFLRADVPATVSTLWDVRDDETMPLLVDFHRRLAARVPPAEALRQAQKAALKSNRPPSAWAAFIYTGP